LIDRPKSVAGNALPDERVFLTWDEVQEMSEYGITFGSHSCRHRILTLLALDQVQKELEESMRVRKAKGVGVHSCSLLSERRQ